MLNSVPPRCIALIPLDNRPVCYDMPGQIAQTAGYLLTCPPRSMLGQLKAPADLDTLTRWVENDLPSGVPVIAALDMVAYGGLIPSRSGHESLESLKNRLDTFLKTVHPRPVLGFSAILRIPNYNNAEEEPDYWAEYGEALYQYSFKKHQTGVEPSHTIPSSVLVDFLQRRERNFELNRYALTLAQNEKLYSLVFCQDDTGAYGLNVQESDCLGHEIQTLGCNNRAWVQTGADEVALTLFARQLSQSQGVSLRIHPIYSYPGGEKIMARYDGISIEAVVSQRIQACGAVLETDPQQADLWLMVHTPVRTQGDPCHALPADTIPTQIDMLLEILKQREKPVALADVATANGGDPMLTEALLDEDAIDLSQLYGYAGWNTPGNTLGTAVALGVTRVLAERAGTFNRDAFQKLLFTRLADDGLYQGMIRSQLRLEMQVEKVTMVDTTWEKRLNERMHSWLTCLSVRLELPNIHPHCTFPCGRTFEIAIHLEPTGVSLS